MIKCNWGKNSIVDQLLHKKSLTIDMQNKVQEAKKSHENKCFLFIEYTLLLHFKNKIKNSKKKEKEKNAPLTNFTIVQFITPKPFSYCIISEHYNKYKAKGLSVSVQECNLAQLSC